MSPEHTDCPDDCECWKCTSTPCVQRSESMDDRLLRNVLTESHRGKMVKLEKLNRSSFDPTRLRLTVLICDARNNLYEEEFWVQEPLWEQIMLETKDKDEIPNCVFEARSDPADPPHSPRELITYRWESR